jgi:tRNA A22 N-methylase
MEREEIEKMAMLGRERQVIQADASHDLRLRMWAVEQVVKHGSEHLLDEARSIYEFLTEKTNAKVEN